MLEFDKDIKVWITSDTHYSHTNICRGITNWRTRDGGIPISQTRDFPNLEKMNSTIVNNINEVVGQDDVLIHLGDWSFGGFENIQEFRERIICKNVHLILGNHDHHIERNRQNCQDLFSSVQNFTRIVYFGETIEICHYPISSWNGLRKGRIHLHGHSHLPHNANITKGRRMDVGVDGNPDFRPYDLHREIIVPLKKLPIGSEMGPSDHHMDDLLNVVG